LRTVGRGRSIVPPPSMKNVGVPFTPLRTPCESARILAAYSS
jgi:hypothetical protein